MQSDPLNPSQAFLTVSTLMHTLERGLSMYIQFDNIKNKKIRINDVAANDDKHS